MSPRAAAENLRRTAEARLKAEIRAVKMNQAEQTRLVHELQVHQVELEIQNHALSEARSNLETALARYTELYDAAPAGYFTLDRRGRILKHNRAASRLLGGEIASPLGKPFRQFVAEEDRNTFTRILEAAQTPSARNGSDLALVAEGVPRTRVHVLLEIANNPDDETFLVVATDVTARKLAEEARLQSESTFRSLYSAMTEGMALHEMVYDEDGNAVDYVLLEVNPAYESILHYSRQSVIGHRASEVYGVSPPPHIAQYATVAETGLPMSFESAEGLEGRIYSVSAFSPARNQFATVFSDVTTQRKLQQQLEHFAHFDALTGLPNRTLLADRLGQAMAQTHRHEQNLAVAYIDLDGFKAVNDTHGHDVGDELLAQLARRMRHVLRDGDTLARLGGDEFIAVMSEFAHPDGSAPMLDRLLHAAAEPFWVNGSPVHVSASIGVTFYPQAEELDADQLLRQADQAMYQAKLSGKNRYQLFDAGQDRSTRTQHEHLDRIRRGLAQEEFVLFYQPKVNMRTGQVIGLEALIRWQHPERGLLPPAAFLSIIEEHQLGIELGEWVIDRALRQHEEWLARRLDLPVSVNIGALQLQQANYVERLRALLTAHPNVQPGDLELEVLETSALQDVSMTSVVISTCSRLGVHFALDDFGTGYSSLTYLKKLPAAILKIDQSFVHDLLIDPEALAILEGVIGLATAFQRQSIAEGVESVESGVMLIRLGCELAQGFVIAPPMPAQDIPVWLALWRPDPRWSAARKIRPDRIPLLHAEVEHRTWMTSIEATLNGNRVAPPPTSEAPCRFDAWLAAEHVTEALLKSDPRDIHQLHRQLHEQAEALVLRHERGEDSAALAPQLAVFRQHENDFKRCLEALVTADD